MPYRRLLVFVEGATDEQFFRSVLLTLLRRSYDHVEVVRFREMKKPKLEALVQSTARMQADYVFVHDLDQKPCVTMAKAALHARHPWLDPARVHIVCTEIESWYCSGLPPDHPGSGALRLARISDTREVTKEVFDHALRSGRPRLALLTAMLQGFDLPLAARRNVFLRRFLRKHAGVDL